MYNRVIQLISILTKGNRHPSDNLQLIVYMRDLVSSLESIAQFMERRWPTIYGLLTSLVLLLILVSTISLNDFVKNSILICGSTLLVIGWVFARRVPRVRNGRVGFLISIHCEDGDGMRLRSDFSAPLRRSIKSGVTGNLFDVIELSNHLAGQVRDSEEAEATRIKARAHFMVYGRVRLRAVNGVDTHIIELNGIVSHGGRSSVSSGRSHRVTV